MPDRNTTTTDRPIISARQVAFNMPTTWEECLALGLDPLTGEPLERECRRAR